MTKKRITKKITIVGEGACGKTCILVKLTKGTFTTDYTPTVFQNSFAAYEIKKQVVELWLWDTAGQEDYNRIITLTYPDTDLLIICFSIDDRNSFEAVKNKWMPELKFHCRNVPYILVGTKSDLRRDSDRLEHMVSHGSIPVTTFQGMDLANEIGALKYFECSAKDGIGLDNIFRFAAEYLHNEHETKKGFSFKKFFEKLFCGICK
ncbi:small Ras GTP-binding protein [Hamiltosporidium tvaerminnensis]|uniref:Small Ras GTP-binding protein n=1 Tax=Hamiltosporidium tvaerminnensis TaxID=1176355 RepID=A0A4Q9LRL9_9MICR|nr:putative small GTPase super [Hamiltosporidium tvaerminnensis]TBT97396.1 small Ras GTP-binding protein [Hamiltosporidium tvaerminnensis]TBU11168.1 small Ras GTP-binding protein [Hamiltosporidium tvaerminnensis]